MADKRLLAGGMRAVFYAWLPLDASLPVPATLHHRIELALTQPAGAQNAVVTLGPIKVLDTPPAVLRPPLRGGTWLAAYDPLMTGGHRTAIYAVDGHARIPARYAIDSVRLDEHGRRSRGDGSRIADSHGYGVDVLAVADAIVADARDDIREDAAVDAPSTRPSALENASGNYVTLDLGGGRYVFYEHLKHGSVRVRAGDPSTR